MATKAELEAELASLKSRLEERDLAAAGAIGDLDDQPGSETGAKVREALKEHGIDTDALGEFGETLGQNLSDLQKNNPLIALTLVFALGFIAGRASR